MKKTNLLTPILNSLPISHLIPRRLQRLYFSVLEAYGFKEAPASEQLIIEQIAWTYAKLQDCRDSGRLFGVDVARLEHDGKPVTTLADKQAKQAEYELVPSLQASLLKLIAALRDSKKSPKMEDPNEIARLFGAYARSESD